MTFAPKFRDNDHLAIIDFIRIQCSEAKSAHLVLGFSGGLDSAVTLKLCTEALGPEHVTTLFLPDELPAGTDRELTHSYARELGVEYEVIEITPIVNSFIDRHAIEPSTTGNAKTKTKTKIALGNIKARTRMVILYYFANMRGALVVGTGNKSELLVGYFTKYGDGGADLLPLGDLYKTQVRALAKYLDLPEVFITRPPSAGLWEGQTDEDELGITYEQLDQILLGTELGLPPQTIAGRTNIEMDQILAIQARVRRNAHKRRLGAIPKLGARTIGIDYREW